jgi:hypothetical protein
VILLFVKFPVDLYPFTITGSASHLYVFLIGTKFLWMFATAGTKFWSHLTIFYGLTNWLIFFSRFLAF